MKLLTNILSKVYYTYYALAPFDDRMLQSPCHIISGITVDFSIKNDV